LKPRLLSRIARRLRPGNPPGCSLDTARIPENHRVYAIGDVHGQANLAKRMIELIDNDMSVTGGGLSCRIVWLGDYVDRGPDSAGAIEFVSQLKNSEKRSFTWLKGNHEEMLLSFIDAPEEFGPGWLDFGGMQTLWSYGARLQGPAGRADFRTLRDALAARLPLPHLLFLQRLENCISVGDFFFCHAGTRPGVPLDRQSVHDLLWIRQDLSNYDPPCEKVVVHGHTPVAAPEIGVHRINIDTGAFATGVLSCFAIDARTRRILQVSFDRAGALYDVAQG
jgi:serine/threonine protein phosphatase 1